ncbi:hypothetical protein ACFX13_014344 [Malus domestica]
MTIITPAPSDQEDEKMHVPPLDLVGSSHFMEVAQVQPTSTFGDPPNMKFTWKIENFTRLNNKKHYFDIFVVDGYKWRIIIFPKGNRVDCLSMYLDAADSETLPYGWSRFAHFSLFIVNTKYRFNARESDWGFTKFMPFSDLYDPSRGYLVNNTIVVEAEVTVHKVLNFRSYDLKRETGYVGLENQGQSGYMNSLLQTFYHLPYFGKVVYVISCCHCKLNMSYLANFIWKILILELLTLTTKNDMPSGRIPLALQRLFYKLQYSDCWGLKRLHYFGDVYLTKKNVMQRN